MSYEPPCYQPDCEKCPFKDSCRNYIKPPTDNIPWYPYPSTGDPLPLPPIYYCDIGNDLSISIN